MNVKIKIAIGFFVAIVIAVGIGLIFFSQQNNKPGPLDTLAKCLSQKGVKMYGAWWCPHCQNQKKAFGSSWKYINYVECAIGQSGQTKECKDKKIEGYPTWIFPDGKRVTGEQDPQSLGLAVGCKT